MKVFKRCEYCGHRYSVWEGYAGGSGKMVGLVPPSNTAAEETYECRDCGKYYQWATGQTACDTPKLIFKGMKMRRSDG